MNGTPIPTLILPSGRRVFFIDAEREFSHRLTDTRRWLTRLANLAQSEWEAEYLEGRVTALEELAQFAREDLTRSERLRRDRIRAGALRETAGRTPQEAAAFKAKAEEIETRIRKETGTTWIVA